MEQHLRFIIKWSNTSKSINFAEEKKREWETCSLSKKYQNPDYIILIYVVYFWNFAHAWRGNLSLFTASASAYLFEVTSLIFNRILYLSRFHIFRTQWSHTHANDSEYIPRTTYRNACESVIVLRRDVRSVRVNRRNLWRNVRVSREYS